jgi:hypothetical protein
LPDLVLDKLAGAVAAKPTGRLPAEFDRDPTRFAAWSGSGAAYQPAARLRRASMQPDSPALPNGDPAPDSIHASMRRH